MNTKMLGRKLLKKTISMRNIVEDMKSLYEEIIVLEKNNFLNKTFFEIELNQNEKIQIVKWRDKDVYDFTHFNFHKINLKGAFEVIEDNIEVVAIYDLDFGMFVEENSFSDFIYKGIPLR